MAGLKLEAFNGLIPRASNRLLPPMAATVARNTKLLNGEIRGFRTPRTIADFSGGAVDPVRRAFRVVDGAGILDDTWLTFDSLDVDVVRSPIINDGFDRYFWAGEGVPQMNTAARIFNGDPSYILGIPTPSNAPGLVAPAGTDEARAYVYTFESAYGEEGPPSPPTVVVGDAGQWDLSGMDTTVPDAANRNITTVNIYRTVTGSTSSNFYFVDSVALGVSVYADNEPSTTVATNPLLESTTWAAPPAGLEGFVSMPNGYLVGWSGRRLVFSEPYRPHAWPAEYELATEYDIVGLVVWGSTIVIGTQSQPYFGQGTSPLSFTMQKLDAVEPCLSRRGMVATVAGAYYPSINGIVLANSSGAQVITQDILTKEEWATYNPGDMFAAQLGLQLVAFNSPNFGFIFNPTEPSTKLIELDNFDDVDGIETDRYTGNVVLLQNNRAVEWDPATSERLSWRWQSKLYQFPEPLNFGAIRLNFDPDPDDNTDDTDAYYGAYDALLFPAVPSGTAPVAGDPFWDDVIFLAKFNGADAATAYTSVDTRAVAGTFVANAQLDTGVTPYEGTASVLLDGTGDVVDFPPGAGDIAFWQLAAGDDVTVEAVFQLSALPGVGEIMTINGHDGQDAINWNFEIYNNSGTYQLRGRTGFGNTPAATMSPQPSTGTWYHAAMVKEVNAGDNTVKLYQEGVRLDTIVSNNNPSSMLSEGILVGAFDNADTNVFTREFAGSIDVVRVTRAARYTGPTYAIPSATEYYVAADDPAIMERGLNTLNGGALGGSPAQAIGLVPTWTDPETRQPLGGSLLYPVNALSFQQSAIRLIVKTGREGTVRFDKVVYNEDILRLPTGFKEDLWQFDFYGNTDFYSAQIATTPRMLKVV